MTLNLRVSMWRLAMVAMVLLGANIALAQTCNPNAASTFTSWTDGGSSITDNSTGLVWQRCALGQSWTGSSCSGTASTAAWAAAVSGAPAGWRLPNVKELESMVERRCSLPAVDGAAFPAFPTAPQVQFWSSTPGWAVNFSDGSVLPGQGTSTLMAVRYVQGGDAATFNNFDAGPGVSTNCITNVPSDRTVAQLMVNADDTVTDQTTGLTWRRCAEGMSFAGGRCSPTGGYSALSWAQATALSTQAANALAGWRVPNVKELESLVDRSCASPAINGSRFPDQPAVDFWSSTPGWSVNFDDGSVLSGQTVTTAKAVRMVKGGAATAGFTTGSAGAGRCTTQAPADYKLTDWVENADGTVYDGGTGLTWDRCVLGQAWSASVGGCTGTREALSWSAALFRATNAVFNGRVGWRVPNVKELESLVDRRCFDPALNPDFFRGNQETLTWSSTPGWAVNMNDGSVLSGQTAATAMAVRLVRGGNKSGAYDAGLAGVPGVVLAGPIAAADDIVNPALLLPTVANQKLILLTHGWNSSTDAWPATMLGVLCGRLGAAVSTAGAVTQSQVGVAAYCATPQWRVVAFNWKPLALDLPNVLPWRALSNGGHLGEKVGKVLTDSAVKYGLVHLVGHSAGANLVHELGHQLRRVDAVNPKIQSTFLDAFCGYPDRCDYGYWSDWADSYFDDHEVIKYEGTETRMKLCNAANFDVSASYPIATEGLFGDLIGPARHAWPYKCYVSSAASGSTGSAEFDVDCLGSQAGNIGFGLSYLGIGATDPSSFFSARNGANPRGSLQKLASSSVFPPSPGQSAVCGVARTGLNMAATAAGNAISSVANAVGSGVLGAGSTCAASTFVAPVLGPLGTVARLLTCSSATTKRAGVKATGVEPITSWSVLNLNVGRRTNQMRFTVQFTVPVNAVLTAYVDDSQVYRTTQELRSNAAYDTGLIDIPTLERGAHKVAFRLDSVDGSEAAVEISSLQMSGAAVCDLDMDGDGSMTVARDGVLLLRYLMGFRGSALTAGLGIADGTAAQAIADYVGSAAQYDVFGRSNPAPLATTDGLVLLRLMLGATDDVLLNGLSVPPGVLFATSSAVRANVNGKCGTRF